MARKFLSKRLLVAPLVALIALSGAAQAHVTRADLRHDRHEVRQERRELAYARNHRNFHRAQHERRELAYARHELRHDRREWRRDGR